MLRTGGYDIRINERLGKGMWDTVGKTSREKTQKGLQGKYIRIYKLLQGGRKEKTNPTGKRAEGA